MTRLTAPNGTFSDGSESNYYANNSKSSWLIQPEKATSITLSFTFFNTESNNDKVIIYDGANNQAPILRQWSGQTIPPPIISSRGSMYVEFSSNASIRAQGWTANYVSSSTNGIDNVTFHQQIKIYPNPTNGTFTVFSAYDYPVSARIFDIVGRQIKGLQIIKGNNKINVSDLNKGLYLIRFELDNHTYYMERLILN
jgi:hypothetical protein